MEQTYNHKKSEIIELLEKVNKYLSIFDTAVRNDVSPKIVDGLLKLARYELEMIDQIING